MIALVAALAGTATALPGRGTVDKNDLKKGAVTKKAIKKGAVTKKAIKKNAVTTKAIKNNAVTGDKVDEATLQVTRIVGKLRSETGVGVPRSGTPVPVAIPGTWTQQANELDQLDGIMEVVFPPGTVDCFVDLALSRPGGAQPVAFGFAFEGPASGTKFGSVQGFFDEPDFIEPGGAVERSLTGTATAFCDPSSTADPVINSLKLDVIGFL